MLEILLLLENNSTELIVEGNNSNDSPIGYDVPQNLSSTLEQNNIRMRS